MLREDDRCPACGGKLELVQMDESGNARDQADRAEGGTRNG
jgi:uncharacterized protein with PIN domain